MTETPKYKRVLLKLSGEALMGEQEYGIDPKVVRRVAAEIKSVQGLGVEVCLVVGAGNIFRGMTGVASGFDRTSADHMGMLATVMNSIAIQNALEQEGVDSRVQSAFPIASVCEPYIRRKAIRHMEKNRVVVFAAGTGNPFFTTDTAAEMGCDALLKGTQVDGVYTADPKTNPDAKKYDRLDYRTVLAEDLKVMDTSAIALARENDIPIVVFSIHKHGEFARVMCGEGAFTIIAQG